MSNFPPPTSHLFLRLATWKDITEKLLKAVFSRQKWQVGFSSDCPAPPDEGEEEGAQVGEYQQENDRGHTGFLYFSSTDVL